MIVNTRAQLGGAPAWQQWPFTLGVAAVLTVIATRLALALRARSQRRSVLSKWRQSAEGKAAPRIVGFFHPYW